VRKALSGRHGGIRRDRGKLGNHTALKREKKRKLVSEFGTAEYQYPCESIYVRGALLVAPSTWRPSRARVPWGRFSSLDAAPTRLTIAATQELCAGQGSETRVEIPCASGKQGHSVLEVSSASEGLPGSNKSVDALVGHRWPAGIRQCHSSYSEPKPS